MVKREPSPLPVPDVYSDILKHEQNKTKEETGLDDLRVLLKIQFNALQKLVLALSVNDMLIAFMPKVCHLEGCPLRLRQELTLINA